MRKFLFLLLSVFIVTAVSAQDGVINKNLKPLKSDLSKIKPFHKQVSNSAKGIFIPTGEPIGMTNYDLQTNSSSVNRMIRRDDGTISAVWIQYKGTVMPSAPNRGTGYNYFNGTSWQFTTFSGNINIEGAQRTGWGSLMTNSTGEFITAHQPAVNGLFGYGQTIGASNTGWTADNITSGPEAMLWPRSAYSGDNYYIIAVDGYVTAQTEIEALHYYKSTDAGANWTYKGKMPNYNTYNYRGQGDTYAIDARDNYVAVVNFATFGDVVLWKSDDYGETWSETTINDFPVDAYNTNGGIIIDMDEDGVADSIMCSDNTGDVIIDSQGKVHVTFSRMRYLDVDGVGDTYSWFPYTDFVVYWNEDMGPGLFSGVSSPSSIDLSISAEVDTIGWSPDINGDLTWNFAEVGTGLWPFGTYGCGLSAFSSMAIDANDNLYVIYSSVTEGDNYIKTDAFPNAQSFRAVYLTIKDSETGLWSEPVDVTSVDGTNAENVFPEVAKNVGTDNKLHMYVQWDNEPGCYLKEDPGEPITDNYIVYKAIDLDGLKATFNVNMTDSIASGYFVEGTDQLFLGTSMNGWTTPGQDPAYELTESATNDVYTVDVPFLSPGLYYYKYFKVVGSTPSWDNGEWVGDPNREIELIANDVVVNDIFGRNVSINDISNEIKIYPNPSNGTFTIQTKQVCNVEVIDITGKVINTLRVNGNSVMKIQTPGVYFLRFTNENGTGVQRVVVK
jgi:hypothetical protein